MGNEHYLETFLLKLQKAILPEDQNLPVLEADSWVPPYLIFQMESPTE